MTQQAQAPTTATAARVGDAVTLRASVTGSIADGAAATVRVYDRGRGDGERLLAALRGTVRDRSVAVPWQVVGRPGYRTHELQLEFDVEAGGRRTPRARITLQPERLIEVEFATGAGPFEVDAAVPFHVVKQGRGVDRPTFARGEKFRGELPRDYDGELVVRSGGRTWIKLDVGRLPLDADEPIRIRSGPVAPANRDRPLPSRAVADATAVQVRGPLSGAAVGEEIHIVTLRQPPPLTNGHHDTRQLGESAYRWLIKEIFGTNLPPSVVSLVQSREILKDFGARFHIRGGQYLVFRAYPRARQYLPRTRYRVDDSRVLVLTGGGRLGIARAAADGAKGSVVAIAIVAALNVLEGLQRDESWTDILVDIASDTVKSLIGTALGVAVISGITVGVAAAAAAAGATLAIPVGVVVVGGIVLGVVIGVGLDMLDERVGATAAVRREAHGVTRAVDKAGDWVGEQFERFVARPWNELEHDVGRRVGAIERGILDLYMHQSAPRF